MSFPLPTIPIAEAEPVRGLRGSVVHYKVPVSIKFNERGRVVQVAASDTPLYLCTLAQGHSGPKVTGRGSSSPLYSGSFASQFPTG